MGLILPLLGVFAVFNALGSLLELMGILEAIITLWPFILIAAVIVIVLVCVTSTKDKERKSD